MAKQHLSGWTPKTEHLLLYNSDGVGSGGCDIIDHSFEASFPRRLLQELRANGWIGGCNDDDDKSGDDNEPKKGRLAPARTAIDVIMKSLLGLFFLDNTNNSNKPKQMHRAKLCHLSSQ